LLDSFSKTIGQVNRNEAVAGAKQITRDVPQRSTPRTGDFCLSQMFHGVEAGGLTDTTEDTLEQLSQTPGIQLSEALRNNH